MKLCCPKCNTEIIITKVECNFYKKVVAGCKKCNNYFWGYGLDYEEATEELMEDFNSYKNSFIKKPSVH